MLAHVRRFVDWAAGDNLKCVGCGLGERLGAPIEAGERGGGGGLGLFGGAAAGSVGLQAGEAGLATGRPLRSDRICHAPEDA